MKVDNISVFIGDDIIKRKNAAMGEAGLKKDSKAIDGRSLAPALDPIAAKKEQAQKKAMQIIQDAFSGELAIDNDIDARMQKIGSLRKEIADNQRAVKSIEDDRAALREQYGVDADSQEERDLQLLAKEAGSKFSGSGIVLSNEEKKQLATIKEQGLTEYQQRSLEMKEYEQPYADAVTDAQNEIKTENAVINGIKLERLKTDPMGKAQKQADAILDAAGKEIIGMLLEEGREHIDEKQDEEKEKADKAIEKQEKLKERIDASNAKKKEQEELVEDVIEATEKLVSGSNKISDAKQEIKDMMNKMKLVEDDIKGAAVDSEI